MLMEEARTDLPSLKPRPPRTAEVARRVANRRKVQGCGTSLRFMHANAKRIAEGDWAAKAVRQTIDNTDTAIIAASS